jgi:hypothetical protein
MGCIFEDIYHASIEDPDNPYFVMEYYPNGCLRVYAERHDECNILALVGVFSTWVRGNALIGLSF